MAVVSANLNVSQSRQQLNGNQIAGGMADLSLQLNNLLQDLWQIDSEVLENLSNSAQVQFYRDYVNLDKFIERHKKTKQISFSFISFLQIPSELASMWEAEDIKWVSDFFTDSVKSRINKVLVSLSEDGSGDLDKIFTESSYFYEYVTEFGLQRILQKFYELFEYLKLIASSTQADLEKKFNELNVTNITLVLIELDEFKAFVSDDSWNKFRAINPIQLKDINLEKLYVDYYNLSKVENLKVYTLYLEDLIFQNAQNTNEIEKLNSELVKLGSDYRNNLQQNIEDLKAAKTEYDNLKATFDRINTEYAEVKGNIAAKAYGTEYYNHYLDSLKLFKNVSNVKPKDSEDESDEQRSNQGDENICCLKKWFYEYVDSRFNSSLLIWAVLGFLIAAVSFAMIYEIFSTIGDTPNLSITLLRLSFLPIVSLMIWFCFHQYNKQKNIIEEYAHKKTVAFSLSVFADRLDGEQTPEIKHKFYESVFEALHTSPIDRMQKNSGKSESELVAEIGKEIIVHQSKSMISSAKNTDENK